MNSAGFRVKHLIIMNMDKTTPIKFAIFFLNLFCVKVAERSEFTFRCLRTRVRFSSCQLNLGVIRP